MPALIARHIPVLALLTPFSPWECDFGLGDVHWELLSCCLSPVLSCSEPAPGFYSLSAVTAQQLRRGRALNSGSSQKSPESTP